MRQYTSHRLTKRKIIDTLVMSLGPLCSLTLWHFVFTFYFKGNSRCTPRSEGVSRTNRMEKIYFHKKKLVVNTIQLKKYWISCEIPWWTFSLQFLIMQQISCLHLMFKKGFKTIFHDTEKKMIEIMEKI